MNKIIFFFIAVLIYKTTTNTYYFFRIQRLSKMHLEWLAGNSPKFPTYKNEVISLFKKAGIKNPIFNASNIKGLENVECWNDNKFSKEVI